MLTKRRLGRSNSRPVAIAPRKKANRREGDETSAIGTDPRSKAAIYAMAGKERRRSVSRSKNPNLEDSSDIARERDECVSSGCFQKSRGVAVENPSEDGYPATDESLPTRHISSNAIGFGLPPLTSGVQHHTVPMQFTSANPGASASWSHISCPVAPYQWTHSAPLTLATLAPSWPNEPYQTQFHEPPPGINLPPIGDLVDNRCWRNPSGPRQYSGSGMRVLHACNPCRQRKVKCDGTQPCDHCNEVKIRCYYVGTKNERTMGEILERLKNLEEGYKLLMEKLLFS